MVRSILAVIAGYLVMAGGVGALLGVMHIVLPGIYPQPSLTPSLTFMIMNLALGGVCAVVGGYVTGVVAKNAPKQNMPWPWGLLPFSWALST